LLLIYAVESGSWQQSIATRLSNNKGRRSNAQF
jgi:hypothetical protein